MPSKRFPVTISVPADATGQRLDQFLTAHIPDISRARVQQLLAQQKALVNGSVPKPSLRLRGGEQITILADPAPLPLRAIAEDIPLEIVYEDDDLAVINKPAGMMVHAGAGATEDERNRGTLVNALLHRFGKLSAEGGELRPGIVHRLDKDTSGLIIVAKNDVTHRKLGQQFSGRQVKKRYLALVHGWPVKDRGTINTEISRDAVRRIRMTTRASGGRPAVTHYEVRERIASPFGKFALVDVRIETGRTHQIRVHMSSIGHPVVGDSLYRAPKGLRRPTALRPTSTKGTSRSASQPEAAPTPSVLVLGRNFLHAAAIEFTHPRTGQLLFFSAPLPLELTQLLEHIQG
jgi:23S rRNA pseudouridine1911/1915/1917 synthase